MIDVLVGVIVLVSVGDCVGTGGGVLLHDDDVNIRIPPIPIT
jgi:hypothetical protein